MMSPIHRTIALFSIAGGLAACAPPALQAPNTDALSLRGREAHGIMPADNSARLFVGQSNDNTSLILNANGKVIGTAAAPDGVFASDAAGTFYDVPLYINHFTNRVLILQRPYQDSKAISFGKYNALSVAVDVARGVYAVTTTYGGNGGGNSYAYFFKRGASGPCSTVSQPAGIQTFDPGAAFDREGRLFVTATLSSGAVGFAMINGECNAKAAQIELLPGNEVIYPGYKLEFNAKDYLVLGDSYTGHVLTFAHPIHGLFADPISSTVLETPSKNEIPYFRCLSGDGEFLWANYGQDMFAEYRYPQGGSALRKVRLSYTYTCAADPPLKP